jgi:hypothetical protein
MNFGFTDENKIRSNFELVKFTQKFIKSNCIGCGNVKTTKECTTCTLDVEFEETCEKCFETIEKCSCFFKFLCPACHEQSNYSELKTCCRCFGYVRDSTCEKCSRIVPRNWEVCENCLPFNTDVQEFRKKLLSNSKKLSKNIRLCKVCGRNHLKLDSGVCQECSEFTEKCEDCQEFLIGIQCKKCNKVKIPEIFEFKQNEDQKGWDCPACNYSNLPKVLFCESCNHSKNYSFERLFFCEFCKKKSPDQLCKSCYWCSFCSSCHKKNFPTQSLFCSICHSQVKNKSCGSCKRLLRYYELLCINCIK